MILIAFPPVTLTLLEHTQRSARTDGSSTSSSNQRRVFNLSALFGQAAYLFLAKHAIKKYAR
jgi:hypothetical protein